MCTVRIFYTFRFLNSPFYFTPLEILLQKRSSSNDCDKKCTFRKTLVHILNYNVYRYMSLPNKVRDNPDNIHYIKYCIFYPRYGVTFSIIVSYRSQRYFKSGFVWRLFLTFLWVKYSIVKNNLFICMCFTYIYSYLGIFYIGEEESLLQKKWLAI